MATIIEIVDGTLSDAEVLNTNFNNLNSDLVSTNERVDNVNSNVTSQINTLKTSVDSQLGSIFDKIYPIGTVYLSVTENCPIAAFVGTWEKVSEGRVLQGADASHPVGSTIPAGLPNIYGTFANGQAGWAETSHVSGAFARYSQGLRTANDGSVVSWILDFNANRSSSVFGQNTTVQPNAFVVNIWKRVA